MTALVEFVLAPISQSEAALQETGKKMLRDVAVENQQNGRREFTSKHVACALGATPEELGLWTKLELDVDHGVALVATLSKQSDKAPAQYQFKHLSFQEGLYAEHLLVLVKSLQGRAGWSKWESDVMAADFLNNRCTTPPALEPAAGRPALLEEPVETWAFAPPANSAAESGALAQWPKRVPCSSPLLQLIPWGLSSPYSSLLSAVSW